MRKTLPKKVQTAIFGRLLCFGQIVFYHCLNSRNEEVFGQKKNPRYLRQNISLDDQAERTFGGRATLLKPTSTLGPEKLLVAGQNFFGWRNTGRLSNQGPPLLTQASCSNCKSNNYGMGARQKVKWGHHSRS